MEAGVRVSAVVRFPSTTARVGSWEEGTVRRDKPCLTLLPVPEPAPASTCSFSTSQIGMAMAAIPRNPSTAHGAESATTLNQGRILARPYSSRLLGSQPVCLRKVLNSDPSRSQGRPPPQITTLETDLRHPPPPYRVGETPQLGARVRNLCQCPGTQCLGVPRCHRPSQIRANSFYTHRGNNAEACLFHLP